MIKLPITLVETELYLLQHDARALASASQRPPGGKFLHHVRIIGTIDYIGMKKIGCVTVGSWTWTN